MGNTQTKTVKTVKKVKFGSINDPSNPRAGYYIHNSTVKYHTKDISLSATELPTFKKLNHGYAVTNKRVFFRGKEIQNVTPENFEVINRDKVKLIPGVTLEVIKLNSVIGKHNNDLYCHGVLL
jgi:hypothetical protein